MTRDFNLSPNENLAWDIAKLLTWMLHETPCLEPLEAPKQGALGNSLELHKAPFLWASGNSLKLIRKGLHKALWSQWVRGFTKHLAVVLYKTCCWGASWQRCGWGVIYLINKYPDLHRNLWLPVPTPHRLQIGWLAIYNFFSLHIEGNVEICTQESCLPAFSS